MHSPKMDSTSKWHVQGIWMFYWTTPADCQSPLRHDYLDFNMREWLHLHIKNTCGAIRNVVFIPVIMWSNRHLPLFSLAVKWLSVVSFKIIRFISVDIASWAQTGMSQGLRTSCTHSKCFGRDAERHGHTDTHLSMLRIVLGTTVWCEIQTKL